MSHDEITLGGIPSAEIRRAKRESGGALTDRPTQPLLHALGEMPDGSPAPDVPLPSRQRALDLARAYRSGGEAQRVVGRDGCEEMARWIDVQPDYIAAIDRVVAAELVAQRIVIGPDVDGDPSLREALAALADAKHRLAMLGSSPSPIGDVVGAIQAQIDEWLLATAAVKQARARDEAPSDEALARVKDAERSMAALSSLDPRFSDVLEAARDRRMPDELKLDAPTTGNVTDAEILALARSLGNTPAEISARRSCIIALGLIEQAASCHEMVAMHRAWCAEKIRERKAGQSAASARSSRVIVVDAPTDCDLTGVWDVIDERPMACGDTYLRLQQGNAHIGARRSRTRPAP